MKAATRTAAVVVAAGLVVFAGKARAVDYEFTYSGTSAANGSFSADLFLTTDADGNVLSISGARNGVAVTGVSDYAGGDNVLTATIPFVDYSGLSYAVTDGTAYNVYASDVGAGGAPVLYELNSVLNPDGSPDGDAPVSTTSLTILNGSAIADVPEPASLAVLGAGLLGLGVIRRSRRA